MQYNMSGLPAPQIAPQPVRQPQPAPLPPATRPPRRRTGPWMLFTALGLLGAIAWWLASRGQETATDTSGTASLVRTATAGGGPIARTIRLTGTTGAERFASLITPQMRGSRSGFGRDGRSYGRSSSSSSSSSSSRGSSSSGGSGSSSSSSGSSSGTPSSIGGLNTGQTGSVASTSGVQGAGGMSSAMRSSTSRVSRTPTPRTSSSTNPAISQPSATLGTEGIGTTSSNLIGGGSSSGGGSSRGDGGGEFGLILQDVVKPGSQVKRGQVVAEFDRQYMVNRLDDYRASVAQTEASFKTLKAELEVSKKAHDQTIAVAKAELEKARLDLKAIPVLGAIEAERLRLTAEEAEARHKQLLAEVRHFDIAQRAQLRNAEIDLSQMHIELKRAEANADKMILKAPIDGLTVMQNIFRGTEFAQIQAGDQLWPGMMFMQIVDPSSMVVNAMVNQVDIETLRIGAKASVRFDAFPDLELPARVYSIGAITRPGGSRAQFVKEVPVKLKLEKMDPRVIPDLSVSAEVVIAEETAPSIVPLAAVFREQSSDEPYVLVKTATGWERRKVVLGEASNIAVAVRSGIKRGEVVALEPPPDRKSAGIPSS